MVSSISNDKILPQTNDRNSSVTDKRSSSAGEQGGSSSRAASVDDTVQLSSAGRMISQDVSGARANRAIENAEQAKSVALKIRAQIESSGSAAMQAHGQIESGQLTTLLESSAA
ncbi:MAG: hypothetical protein P1R74_13550 [Sedimenticola sp.]|nr:hypothetical protein [Sedimenticola sp.]